MSDNGFCQKCFEAKLIEFVTVSTYQELKERCERAEETIVRWHARHDAYFIERGDKLQKQFAAENLAHLALIDGQAKEIERLSELVQRDIGSSAFDEVVKERDALRAERDELCAFKDEWDSKDGNSPGYNLQKARTYGEQAFKYKTEADALRAQVQDFAEALEAIIVGETFDYRIEDLATARIAAERALAKYKGGGK